MFHKADLSVLEPFLSLERWERGGIVRLAGDILARAGREMVHCQDGSPRANGHEWMRTECGTVPGPKRV